MPNSRSRLIICAGTDTVLSEKTGAGNFAPPGGALWFYMEPSPGMPAGWHDLYGFISSDGVTWTQVHYVRDNSATWSYGSIGMRLGTAGQVDNFGGGVPFTTYPRTLSDPGITSPFTESLRKTPWTKVTPTDTGLSLSPPDSIKRPLVVRSVLDTGLFFSETLARTVHLTRNLLDGGLVNFSDGLGRPLTRAISDTGLNFTLTDKIATPRLFRLTDTGVQWIEPTLSKRVSYTMTGTGLTVSDVANVGPQRRMTDVGLAVSSSVARAKLIAISDNALFVSDSMAAPKRRYQRTLGDTGLHIIVTIAGATKVQQHAPYAYRTGWAVLVDTSDNFTG
jgi:hypothetical protein